MSSALAITGTITTAGINTSVCWVHEWELVSLRGSNRHRRVETSRCKVCGVRERAVWSDYRAAHPDSRKRLSPEKPEAAP